MQNKMNIQLFPPQKTTSRNDWRWFTQDYNKELWIVQTEAGASQDLGASQEEARTVARSNDEEEEVHVHISGPGGAWGNKTPRGSCVL